VKDHEFPIENISPTHMARTKDLLDQGIVFAKMGGMIDISTGGTNYIEPYKAIQYALDQGAGIDYLTFSSDGNAGLDKKDANGKLIGFKRASFQLNLEQAVKLIQDGLSISDAFKIVSYNPAKNLGLSQKGEIEIGRDADFCFFDESFQLTEVFSGGKQMMDEGKVIAKNSFD